MLKIKKTIDQLFNKFHIETNTSSFKKFLIIYLILVILCVFTAFFSVFGIIMLPFVLIFGTLFFLVYMLPYLIANYRKHLNQTAILFLNLLLGWTFLGWVAALVWSFTNSPIKKTKR